MTETIEHEELKRAINANEVTLVETLRDEHFAQGHLPGAIHIHFEAVAERAPELLPDKNAEIVTYCSNSACRNSELAADELESMGYTNVRRYTAGEEDWESAGLPLEAGKVA